MTGPHSHSSRDIEGIKMKRKGAYLPILKPHEPIYKSLTP